MRHAEPHTARTAHSNPGDARPQADHDSAYNVGQLWAAYWPAGRKAMPTGAVLGDWRNACARDFLASAAPADHCLLPSVMAGFDDEAEDKYSLAEIDARRAGRGNAPAPRDTVLCIDVEDAEDWLTLGQTYHVRAVIGTSLIITDDTGDEAARHHVSHFIRV